MNLFLNLKIRDYEKWSLTAIDKIIKCVDSSITEPQFDACNKMIDNFVLLSITNSYMTDNQIKTICIQLKSYLKLKKSLA
jgi:valyl-tRNA synthetase